MDTTPEPPGIMLRFDLPCQALGFEAPPVAVQLRFLRSKDSWTLLILVPAGKAREAAAWIQRQTPTSVATAPGLAPRTLRCELHTAPDRWLAWLTAARILQVDLGDQGMATLFVQGTTEQLATFASRLGGERKAARQRVSGTRPIEEVPLTPRQLEVLCNAVQMGYYDVPHRVNLRRLGNSMNLSVSAVSQLLRRAQAQIIRGFIDANTLARGKRLSDQDETAKRPPKEA